MRPIDADALFDFLTEQLDKETGAYSRGRNAGINIARSALHDKTITPTITPPKNYPLHPTELLEMDGEPVWVVNSPTKRAEGFNDEWAIVSAMRNDAESAGTIYHFENYGDGWLAYRRKPEKG